MTARAIEGPALPGTEPRPGLLAGRAAQGRPIAWREHRRTYAAPPPPGSTGWVELIDLVDRSGLTGRGGAGFPTARKMRSVAAAGRAGSAAMAGRRGRPVVVANGTEGEPYSAKDRVLQAGLPHLVLDGAQWAAAAVGADRVVICIDRTETDALTAMRHALAERLAAEPGTVTTEVADTPPRFVAGESSALIHWVNGGPAKPTVRHSHEMGVNGRPTLVQNVETLAHLAQICHAGAEWFRLVGTPEEPGTAMLTVGGAVGRPSVVEAPIGTTIDDVLALAGGPVEPLQAVLVGGFFGTWAPAGAALAAPYSHAGLRPLGAAPGAGVIVALPARACGLAETARILAWYSSESAGQCGPCRFGLADLAAGAARVAPDVGQLLRWADQIEGRGGPRASRRRGRPAAKCADGLPGRSRQPPRRLPLPRGIGCPDHRCAPARQVMAMTMTARRLTVDIIRCDGHGICAEMLPEWIHLDDWGFPAIRRRAVPPELLAKARWAVANCPVLALRLES